MDDGQVVEDLYRRLLDAWNRMSAEEFARLFTPADALVIGFDGSEMRGRAEIQRSLADVFADHEPADYVGIVRSLTVIAPGVALLHAAAGMVPKGGTELNDNLAIQSLVALHDDDGSWRIALWHNTPAAYHGRPEDRAALFDELRGALSGR